MEKLADPLTHLIRNSIDHGLELPETRRANGKSSLGSVTLRAFHQGGSIVVEVHDDAGTRVRARLPEAVASRVTEFSV